MMNLLGYIHKKIAKIYYSHFYFFVFFLFSLGSFLRGQRGRVFLLPHGGLGDLLALNGAIRRLAKNRNMVLVVTWRTLADAKILFRDLPTISFYIVYGDRAIAPSINGRPYRYNQWKIARLEKLGLQFRTMGVYLPRPSITDGHGDSAKGRVHETLYRDMATSLRVRHDGFFLPRDKKREEDFYRRVVNYLKTDNYVVVHDDPKRGFAIDLKKIPELKDSQTKILYLGKNRCKVKSQTIFDAITTIERARAFHGFDSSFMWLVELLAIKTKSYLHAMPARPFLRNQAMVKSFKKKWILVK